MKVMEYEKRATPTININNDISILRSAEDEESLEENSIQLDEESTESEDDESDYSTLTTVQKANSLQYWLEQQKPITYDENPDFQYQLRIPEDTRNIFLENEPEANKLLEKSESLTNLLEDSILTEPVLKKADSTDSFSAYIDKLVQLRREGNEACTSLKRSPNYKPISPTPEDSQKQLIEYPIQYYIRSGSFTD